jgi:hypothetical protein
MLHGSFSSEVSNASHGGTAVHEGSGYVLYFQARDLQSNDATSYSFSIGGKKPYLGTVARGEDLPRN